LSFPAITFTGLMKQREFIVPDDRTPFVAMREIGIESE
jgi:hypothetical protein